MEFKFSEKEEEFYQEVEDFLIKELPSEWADYNRAWPGGYGSNEIRYGARVDFYNEYRKKLIEKGWMTISWPKEYCGREYTYLEQAIFDERTSYYRAPSMDLISAGMVGPTILRFGTDEQKEKVLGP